MKIKRMLIIALITALIMNMFLANAVSEATASLTIDFADGATIQPGEEFSVSVNLSELSEEVYMFQFAVTYESSKLTLQSISAGDFFATAGTPTINISEAGIIYINWDSINKSITEDCTLLLLTFISVGNEPCEATIGFSESEDVIFANWETIIDFCLTPLTVQIGADEVPAFETVDIKMSHSCSFGNNLTINYYIPAAALEGYENYRLVLKKQVFDETGASYTWDTYELTSYTSRTSGGTAYKVFSFSNIAAKEMGDEIRATLYMNKDGDTYQSTVDVYSIKEYAYNRLEKSTDDNFKRLLVDMLNYGAAAQAYFNYNTGNPVNADLTTEQLAYASATPTLVSAENTVTTDGATAHYYGKTVVLGNSVELKYYMTFDSGAPADTVKLVLTYTAIDGTAYTESIPASAFEYRSDYHAYGAKLTTIAAKDMSCVVTARIYDGDTLISDVQEYSIETYAYNRLLNSTSESFKTLVREMMKYGKSAENYFRNRP